MLPSLLRRWQKEKPLLFSLAAILFAFSTYFCMYAFRKPFTVGIFEGSIDIAFLGPIDRKIVLIISQVIGYTASKFIGIKVVSETSGARRGFTLIALLGLAELALFGFALAPENFQWLFLMLNGLPLGMVWGLVFGFLEGRSYGALLGAGLSASYIVASGVVKSVGKYILDLGYSEVWMPALSALCFVPLLLVMVYCLESLPPPTEEEEKQNTKRSPMGPLERKKFFFTFMPALSTLTLTFMFLTAYRGVRDDFAREIWDALGYGAEPAIFALSEIPAGLVVMLMLGALALIPDPRKNFFLQLGLMTASVAFIGVSTAMFQLGIIPPIAWMMSLGVGLYIAYVPYGCMFFDSLIATTHFVGTAAFMVYVTDAFGYLGSVGVMLYKNFANADVDWLTFFIGFSYVTCATNLLGFLFVAWYFKRKIKSADTPHHA